MCYSMQQTVLRYVTKPGNFSTPVYVGNSISKLQIQVAS
jgi:hypothetical protein